MRALHDPDAFPAGDLGLRHVSSGEPDAWRPWRAYAALHLWTAREDAHEAAAA